MFMCDDVLHDAKNASNDTPGAFRVVNEDGIWNLFSPKDPKDPP